jgi:asparagine synthase (glutamine-hydrolysing)
MCGILGGINQKIDYPLLNMIRHRGPDRQSIYEDTKHDNPVWLAHARLSIIDLSEAGNQPMCSVCGNYVIIFNGEIYNHLDLRKELQFKNFKGHSDTETLLYYLIEKGIDGLNDLNGIFAFAFYDKKKGLLLIIRDKYGIKPLYYSLKNNKFIFSSEIRPIQKIVKSDIDTEVLPVLLNLRYIPSPYTLHKDIKKLRPGHYLQFDLGKSILQYKEINYDIYNYKYSDISFPEAVSLYERYFSEAIERQLMADVDVGIFLSGGIDSALVASVASSLSSKPLKAFTVGFDSNHFTNEIEMAVQTAQYLNIEHNIVKINDDNFFNIFEECSKIVEEPLATTSIIPMYYLSKTASEQVKVVLTGQGADEPLGGYKRYQGELLYSKYPNILFHIASWLIRLSKTTNERLIRAANSLSIKNDIERFLNIYGVFTSKEIVALTGKDTDLSSSLIGYYYDLLRAESQLSSVNKMMSLDMRMNLSDDLLLYTDKITMNFSMECRVPLLDFKLIDFLESLPLSYKLTTKNTKIIHKAYAKKVLPKYIVNRPKLGFQSPTAIWFKESSKKIEDILLSKNSPILNYLNINAVRQILNEHNKIGINREKQVFLLLSLNSWISNHR